MEKYIDLKDTDTKLDVQLYYSKGGMNYWNYKVEPRGYYLSVKPVKMARRNGVTLKEFIAFDGYKQLILEVNRKSNKQYEKAIELSRNMETFIVNKILNEKGYELA